MYRLTTIIAITTICLTSAGCGHREKHHAETTPSKPMITSFTPAPLTRSALTKIMLVPEQINAAMATEGMVVTNTQLNMSDDSATMAPRECLAVDGAAQAPIYADSGFTDEREETFGNGDRFTHYAHQAVVLFPKAEHAAAFYDAQAKQWPQCRTYSHVQTGTEWEAGRVENKDGMLSVITVQTNAQKGGWSCGRALTARNNVVVDVNTCSADPGDSAVTIAQQIAEKVDSPLPQR